LDGDSCHAPRCAHGETGSPGQCQRHCATGGGHWSPICVCVAPSRLTVRRGDVATRVGTISRSRIGVPKRSATTIDLRVQTCTYSGCCLRVVIKEYSTAVSSAHCTRFGSAVS